jgi:hypothetical protein
MIDLFSVLRKNRLAHEPNLLIKCQVSRVLGPQATSQPSPIEFGLGAKNCVSCNSKKWYLLALDPKAVKSDNTRVPPFVKFFLKPNERAWLGYRLGILLLGRNSFPLRKKIFLIKDFQNYRLGAQKV